MADNDQDPVTQTQLQTALAKLQTDTLDQAKRAAILEAERIADERTTPATWTDFAWRLMWLVPRFFASGFFFMLAGALLLYIASTDIPNRHATLTFVFVVLGVAVFLYGTGTQGLGRLESSNTAAKYNVVLAGGAGVLAFCVAFGMVTKAPQMKQAFQVERKYLRIPVIDQSRRQLLDWYVWEFSIDGDGIPMRRRGSQLEILVPYVAGEFVAASDVTTKVGGNKCLDTDSSNLQNASLRRIMATYQMKADKIAQNSTFVATLKPGDTKEYPILINHSFHVSEANAEFPLYPDVLCIDVTSPQQATKDAGAAGARQLERAPEAKEQPKSPERAIIPTAGTE